MNETINIPVTFSPHFVKEQPRGYYLLAQRLFRKGTPHLVKKQFIGYTQSGLVMTVGYKSNIINLFGMSIFKPTLNQEKVTWLSECSIFPMRMGFKAYIPVSILQPSAGSGKFETTATFRVDEDSSTYYIKIGKITAEILLGKVAL